MNISRLKKQLDNISEIKVIDKDFEVDGTIFNFMGFVRNGKKLSAAVLAYNEELRELREGEKIKALYDFDLDEPTRELTKREEAKLTHRFDDAYVNIQSIFVDKAEFTTECSHGSLLEQHGHTVLLTEFLRNGWQGEKFAHISFDYCFIHIYDFSNEYETIPELDYSEITLSFRPRNFMQFEEIPLRLQIGECDEEAGLSDGTKIYIRNLELKDMLADFITLYNSEQFKERFSPEEIQKQIDQFTKNFRDSCPEGKVLLAVEYEAPSDVTVAIELKSALDSPPPAGNSCMGFILRSDLIPIHDGMKLKTHVFYTPFDPDTASVEAEIFTMTKTVKPKDIII